MNIRIGWIGLVCLVLSGASIALAEDHPVVHLWSAGAPGSEAKKDVPEKVEGTNISNIQNPSLTVYLPTKETATGVAIVIAPGGGHQRLAIQHEGYNVAKWFADHGIAAFILKYRLSKDGAVPEGQSPYTVDRDELGDAQRAIRLVRSRAAEWGVLRDCVGIVGFSAGGEVSLLAATRGNTGDKSAADSIDRESAVPNFVGLIYPGGLQRNDITITKDCPPVFLACGANDRPTIAELMPEYYLKFKREKVPVELHIYADVGHGFGIRDTDTGPYSHWPEHFRTWIFGEKAIHAPKAKDKGSATN